MKRTGIYLVPTDHWYIERAVWLVAGIVLLTSTALALLVHPLFILGVTATGLASIMASLTGFCIVGNILFRLGFTPMLDSGRSSRWYFMQTDSWYLERRIYPTVGINTAAASMLMLVHSSWWAAFTGFVGCAMVFFATSGYCILANVLYRLGAEPRLAPGASRQWLILDGAVGNKPMSH
jgi:hypothetical protein